MKKIWYIHMAGILELVLFGVFNGHQMCDFAASLSYIILKGFYLGFGPLFEQNNILIPQFGL